MADKFSFNVTKQFTPSCLYTEPRERRLPGTSNARHQQTMLSLNHHHHHHPQPSFNRPSRHRRHQLQQKRRRNTTHRIDDVARQRYLPDMPRRLAVAMHAVCTTMMKDNAWEVREGRGLAKGHLPPYPLSTDKSHPAAIAHTIHEPSPSHSAAQAVSTAYIEDNLARQWTCNVVQTVTSCDIVTVHFSQGEKYPPPISFSHTTGGGHVTVGDAATINDE
jgi:hypothetical protein